MNGKNTKHFSNYVSFTSKKDKLGSECGVERQTYRTVVGVVAWQGGHDDFRVRTDAEQTAVERQQPVADTCAQYAYSGSGNHVIEPVAFVVKSQESGSESYAVSAYRQSEAVFHSDKFGSHKHGGCVSGGK